MQKIDIIGDHYTYSDMAGGQLKSVPQGRSQEAAGPFRWPREGSCGCEP